MNNTWKALGKWFLERPLWLQSAAMRCYQQSEFTEQDFSDLADQCLLEVSGELSKETCSFSSATFFKDAIGPCSTLRLCSISQIRGVNALASEKPLEFGEHKITIVYGYNGSGKSGYVKLLKHVCGARETEPLHRNIYQENPDGQGACISFELNGKTKDHVWAGEDICDELTSVDIFDSSFDKVFIDREDEASYEPPILSFISSLTSVCEKVALVLEKKLTQNQSRKPNIPSDMKATPEGRWYENIDAKTSLQDINKHCIFCSTDKAEMQALQQRLAEQAPAAKAKQLRIQRQYLDGLIQDAHKHLKQLSLENCQVVIEARKTMVSKKKAADIAAKEIFSNSKLGGVGSNVWKELWNAARTYSVSYAYKNLEYPNTSDGSHCVLCHQPLSPEAKDRLVSFEQFMVGEMQKIAESAAKKYETTSQSIEPLPTLEALKTRIDAAKIQGDLINQVITFFTQLQTRKDQLFKTDSEEATLHPIPTSKWIEEARKQSKKFEEDAKKYDEDAKSDNREKNIEKLSRLQAKKWLYEQHTAIDEEITRLKTLNNIQEAKKLTNTKALSQKKGELAEALITDAFVQRFNEELRALGARNLKVELVKSKVSKGKVLHRLQLRGASQYRLTEVLSEGEKRIISIAAFLADVTGKDNQTPFIFDDPISSLDQNYEEAVVQRLIDLSLNRQVIVFTHRLSLLAIIKFFAEKKNIKYNVTCIRSVNGRTGVPTCIPLLQRDIASALNALIDQQYPKAQKAYERKEFDYAETLLKAMCSDFRVLLERSIEDDLLCGIVQRFQRQIYTLKLKKLVHLKSEDCCLLDELMTKYSGFVHSQPTESPVNLPEPNALLSDMKKLKEWRKEYTCRSI